MHTWLIYVHICCIHAPYRFFPYGVILLMCFGADALFFVCISWLADFLVVYITKKRHRANMLLFWVDHSAVIIRHDDKTSSWCMRIRVGQFIRAAFVTGTTTVPPYWLSACCSVLFYLKLIKWWWFRTKKNSYRLRQWKTSSRGFISESPQRDAVRRIDVSQLLCLRQSLG